MRFIVFDAECYFDSEYTFKKLSTEEFVRHPKFELHGAAIKEFADQPAFWLNDTQLREWLNRQDWSDIFLVSHHAQWDHFALSHHYNVRPKMSGCTLSMSRLCLGNHLSVALDAVRKHFNMPLKTTPYNLFRGLYWREMTPQVQQLVAEGACDEVESIWKIFGLLYPQFPKEELGCIDLTIKMFCQPTLRADLTKLATVWTDEVTKKSALLKDLNVTEADLQSAERFAALLRAEGVEPATKTGKNDSTIYAFAKTDPFMKELQEYEDDRVRMLAEARLGVKSTLLQTRAETIGWMGRRGALCIYLRYAGAHTSRWSGGDNSNWQNGVPAINDAILPPEGYALIKPDASQVECRLLNFVAGQEDKIADFRLGRDPYVGVAEAFCGHPVNKKDHPDLRQAGKVVELQAGYGSGGEKIRATLRNKAGIIITPEDGEKYKWAYRNTHPRVTDLWKEAGEILADLAAGRSVEWGPVVIADHRIWLPNGIPLIYETLEWYIDEEIGDKYWRLKTRSRWHKMYGAKLVENLIQALARLVVSQAMLRIDKLGYRIVNMRHDDLWILVPEDGREITHAEKCRLEMCREPVWLPGIPLDAELH